jgi:RNA polymerase sigma-70 factor, ECF subfamily
MAQFIINIQSNVFSDKATMEKEFEDIIAKNQGRIRYIAARYSEGHDFDDLYQEILMQLWRSFDSFSNQSSRETWLYKVALNTACTFVGKTIKRRELNQAAFIESSQGRDVSVQPGEETSQADILDKFMDLLSSVDSNILMLYLDNVSSEASAEIIGISANAIRLRLKRIKSAFETQFIGD